MKRRPRNRPPAAPPPRYLPDCCPSGRSRRSSQFDDPVLREYNAYLAELAKDDARKQNRTTA